MEKEAAERDPVCGMKVRDECKLKSIYQGREYHFCSDECREAFDIAPEKYVGGQAQNRDSQ